MATEANAVRLAGTVMLLAVVAGPVEGCGPTGTSASGEGSGSASSSSVPSGATATSTTADSTTATSISASSTGGDLECPAENVFDGDLTLLTGDDAISLYGLTEVTGRLTISSDDIVDLSFLQCLRAVGALLVQESGNLKGLEGLEQLSQVGAVNVIDNPVLESMSGLSSLTEVHTLRVRGNPAMTTLGLGGLKHATVIRIGMCTGFTAEGGLGLTDVAGLSGLRGGVEDVYIEGNDDLASLEGLREWADNGVTISVLVVRHNRQLPTEYAQEIVDLFGVASQLCGNEGDDGPWTIGDPICDCYPPPPGG